MNPILAPGSTRGNNADGRVVRVLVMESDAELTGAQQAGVEQALQRHLQAYNLSLAGHLTDTVFLEDGSRVEFTSNSGQHEVRVWPPGGKKQAIAFAGYLITPRDANKPDGWDEDVDSNPIPAIAYVDVPDVTIDAEPITVLHTTLQAAPVNWFGPDGEILTWDHGGNNRYSTNLWDTAVGTSDAGAPSEQEGIYYRGTRINTTGFGVGAAAVIEGWLVAIGGETLYYAESPLDSIDAALAEGRFVDEVDVEWSNVTVTGSVSDAQRVSAWHFAPDGATAACAVVYDSYISGGAWSYKRALTEELPQAKRYLALSISGGVPVAALSDTAFSGEEFATKIDGAQIESVMTQVDYTVTHSWGVFPTRASQTGTLTFHGKRLIGIDWAEDGTEIEVTIERSGTGASSSTFSSPNDISTIEWDQTWGIFANGVELVSAACTLSTITATVNTMTAALTCAMPGAATLEYMTLAQLDARCGIAAVERITLTASNLTASASSVYSNESLTVAAATETWVDGELVDTVAVTFPTDDEPAVKMALNVNDAGRFLRDGRHFSVTTPTLTGAIPAVCGTPHWPSMAGHNTENVLNHYMEVQGDSNVIRPNHYASYPNQVVDLLLRWYGFETESLATVEYTLRLTNTNGVNLSDGGEFGTTYYAMSVPGVIQPARNLGVRQYDPESFLLCTRDSYFHALIDTMVRRRETFLSDPEVGIEHVHLGSAFNWDADAEEWVETDLREYFADTVDDEVGGGTVDRDTFTFDTVSTV